VATTRSGRYCLKRAQERITRRKPIARTCLEVSLEVEGWRNDHRLARDGTNERGWGWRRERASARQRRRTKESEIMVLRPAVILGSERGTLLVLFYGRAAVFALRCFSRLPS
jgi:hypothetical protein